MTSRTETTEAQRFDAGVWKIFSVSRNKLFKQEEEWKRKRATKATPVPKPRASPSDADDD